MNYSLFIAAVSLIVGLYLIFSYIKTKNSGDPIKGVVIGYLEERDNRMKPTYNPIVKFELNGESYEMPTELAEPKKMFEPGDEIDIYFIQGKDYVMRAGGKKNSLKEGLTLLAISAALLILNLLSKK